MDSGAAKEVTVDIPGVIRVHKDGSVERLHSCPHVPPSPEDPNSGVASKDVTICKDAGVSARLFLPKLTSPTQKLPVLVYFYGGGFCVQSAFSLFYNRYMTILASRAQVLVVSIEYRRAPEYPLPTAYEDCWAALQWVASHCGPSSDHDPWLVGHGDFKAFFMGGDSAGANIAHNMAMRAGNESLCHGVKILGAFFSHPYYLDSKSDVSLEIAYKIWEFVYPCAPGGPDSPMINPMGDGAPSMARLDCGRVLVLVAGEDAMRDSGVRYCDALRESGYKGKVELFEVDGEGHAFHIYNPVAEKAELMFQRLASFLSK